MGNKYSDLISKIEHNSIVHLDLSKNGVQDLLTAEDMQSLLGALMLNYSIVDLDLSEQHFGSYEAQQLAVFIKVFNRPPHSIRSGWLLVSFIFFCL